MVNVSLTNSNTIIQDLSNPALVALDVVVSAISLPASQISGIPASLATQNLDDVNRVGIGTTDSSNNFSVFAPTSLFSNSGDMRVSISKGSSANVASIIFQDNFSARVQLGLLGNDSFSIQTSPDGSTFTNSLVFNQSTANVGVQLPTAPTVPLDVNGPIRTRATIVASLPSAATSGAGARSFVTDATSTTFLSVVSGSGSNSVPVVSDGTNWRIG